MSTDQDLAPSYSQLVASTGACTETAASVGIALAFTKLASSVAGTARYIASGLATIDAGVSSKVSCIINLNNNLTPDKNAALQDMA